MKNSTIKTIYAILTGANTDEAEKLAVIRELEDDFAKQAEKASAKLDTYEAIHDVVMAHLSDKPMTVAEIFTAGEGDWPEGTTKNKISYGLTHYWENEVTKIQGKVNEYRRK